MNAPFQRAVLLLHQERFADAVRELEAAERLEPDSACIAELRAVALSRLRRYEAAIAAARRAVELNPESNPAHSVLARVHLERNDLRAAERAVTEALRLDPEDPFDHGLLARIWFEQGRWSEAVAAADAGLVFDPEHDLCLHYRAVALVMAGRKEEARRALDALLAEAPDCAATHGAVGMSLIRAGDAEGARAAFLEALRIDPQNAEAREGLVTALRVRHRLYGALLRGLMAVGRFRAAGVWGLALVGILALRGGRWLAERGPDWIVAGTLARAAVWVLVVFAVVAEPLFDLALRMTREGRLALTARAIRSSNWQSLCLAAGLVLGLIWTVAGGALWSSSALAVLMLTFGIRETFLAEGAWVRRRMGAYTVALAAFVPMGFVAPVVGLALGRMGGAPVVRSAVLFPMVTMLGSMFADNLREWLERREPDGHAGPGAAGEGGSAE